VFYIIHQGEGIKTPIDKLLRPRVVEAVSATAPTKAIKEERLTDTQSKARKYQMRQQSSARKPAIFARQIMASPVIGVTTGQLLSELWAVFTENSVHHLPVFDQGKKLQGIVSDRDLLRFEANSNRNTNRYPVSQIMTREVVCAAESTEIRTLAEVMCRQAIGAVLIIDDEIDVTGIVTRTDILRAVVHQAPLELWT